MDSIIYFKAMADETRIRLFSILLYHELNVNEIVTIMEMGQSRISRHLKILIDAGILKCNRDGIWAYYSIADNGPGRKFAESIRYLFKNEPSTKKDLVRASKIIDDRRQKTMTFFNKIASEWDLLKSEILGNFNLSTAILNHIKNSSVAVDLGCGTGELLSKMKHQASQVIGVDSSAKMLEEAKKRFQDNGENLDLRLGELEHLPLGDDEADCAVISMVLHHLSDPCQVFAEVHRILKPGGIFIIADFGKHKNETMRNTYGDHWLGFSHDEIDKWLKSQKFQLNIEESYKLKKSLNLNLYKSINSA